MLLFTLQVGQGHMGMSKPNSGTWRQLRYTKAHPYYEDKQLCAKLIAIRSY